MSPVHVALHYRHPVVNWQWAKTWEKYSHHWRNNILCLFSEIFYFGKWTKPQLPKISICSENLPNRDQSDIHHFHRCTNSLRNLSSLLKPGHGQTHIELRMESDAVHGREFAIGQVNKNHLRWWNVLNKAIFMPSRRQHSFGMLIKLKWKS